MLHEVIRLADASDFVEIEILERGTLAGLNDGDVRLGVSVGCGTFAGSYDQIWVAKEEWASFIANLARLENERRGDASVVSMSPEEFELHLQIFDRAGHLSAHGFLSRYQFRNPTGKASRARIEFYLSVDSGLLREIVLSLGFESR